MDSDTDRRAGLLWGSLVAESLSLGVHWIYDVEELMEKHGRVSDFTAPGPESYHPRKQAGEQGHVGDQALRLLDFVAQERKWDAAGFLQSWRTMWPSYDDYVDHATKETLANLQRAEQGGVDQLKCGSNSDELAGPARVAPLLAFHAGAEKKEMVRMAVEQTLLTHRSPEAEQAAVFLASACHRLLSGDELAVVIKETAPGGALDAATAVEALSPADAIGKLGRSCSLSAALPSVIYLALRYPDAGHLEEAFEENAMAGGDNCARGLALGMLLGAAHGDKPIPQRWLNSLAAAERVRLFIGAPAGS